MKKISLLLLGILLMQNGFMFAQCPDPTNSTFSIIDVDKQQKVLTFQLQSSEAVSADIGYSQYGIKKSYSSTSLVNGVTDTIHFNDEYFNIYALFNAGDIGCTYQPLVINQVIDLSCQAYSYISDDNKCEANLNKQVSVSFNYPLNSNYLTEIKNKNGVTIDTFTNNDYSMIKTYSFANVGFDTLQITYSSSYCTRTEYLPIIVSGDCSNFNCNGSIDVTSDNQSYTITVNHSSANFYSWYYSNSSGIFKKIDTTVNNLSFNKINNTQYNFQVWAIDLTNYCYIGLDTSFASECYATIDYYKYLDTIVWFSLSFLDPGKSYILYFGDDSSRTISGVTNTNFIHQYPKADTVYLAYLKILDGTNLCNVISLNINLKSCQSKLYVYPTGDASNPYDKTFYVSAWTTNPAEEVKIVLDFGDGKQHIANNSGPSMNLNINHIYPQNGTYFPKLIVEWYADNNIVCSDIFTSTVMIGEQSLLAANFSYLISDSIYLYDNSIGNIVSYHWDLGDGNAAYGKKITHKYIQPGIYTVCLTVKDQSSNINTYCQDIVFGKPSCSVKANFTTYKDTTPLTIGFINLSQGGDKYYWDFGNGNFSTEESPVYTFSQMGIYEVTLSVSSSNGCIDKYKQKVYVGTFDCNAKIDVLVDELDKKITLANTTISSETSEYYWNYGDGTVGSGIESKMYSKSGKYTISMLVYNPQTGCNDYIEKSVYIDKPCRAKFSYYVDTATNTIRLQNQSINTTHYYWYFSDGSYTNEVHPSHQFSAPGIYKIYLKAYNDTLNCIDSHEEYVTINQSNDCEADFIYGVKENNEVLFFDRSRGNVIKYLWNLGNGTTSQQMNPHTTYNHPGIYNVCLTVVNNHGISNITCKPIFVNSNACFADYDYVVQPGKEVVFSEKALGNPTQYNWDFGDNTTGTGQQVIHTYANAGYYLTSLNISATSNCNSTAYKLLNIDMPNQIKAAIITKNPQNTKKAGGYPVDFIGAGLGDDVRIKWTFGDGTEDTTTTTPTHVYSNPGTYIACYIISDPITGQSDTACTTITITDVRSVNLSETVDIYPLPFNERLYIVINSEKATSINLSVYDLTGRSLINLDERMLDAGKHTLVYNTTHLKSGTYILKVQMKNQRISRLIIKQ